MTDEKPMTDEEWTEMVKQAWYDLNVIIEQCGRDNVTWEADKLNMDPITYHVLGVAGEAGEVANKFKKLARPGIDVQAQWREVLEEMADTLTHLCALASLLNYDLVGGFWEKREINMERFSPDGNSRDQSTVASAVRKRQQGPLGATAFVCESDLQESVPPSSSK